MSKDETELETLKEDVVELKPVEEDPLDGACVDLVGKKDEETYVVTIQTMMLSLKSLWDQWRWGCKEFDVNNLRMPGVYRDDMFSEANSKSSFTIVLNIFANFLPKKLCKKRIRELNRLFGENFVLNFEESFFDG